MKISIIGSGVVGKATGIGFHMHGNDVLFHDVNREKLTILKREGYKVTEDITEAVHHSIISFVCVQTPMVNGRMDLRYLEKATIDVARALSEKEEYHIVVIRSTVLPSTTHTIIIPLLEQYSELKAKKDFGVCMNPEFLREATALHDFLNPSRIVIGELDTQSGNLLEKLYEPFKAPIFRVDLCTAEMIKYVANCFLATKISFFNEVYIICRKLGLDSRVISEVASLDPRIGKYGIYGGRPFGGDCLPKDLEAFIVFVREMKINPELLSATFKINKKIAKLNY